MAASRPKKPFGAYPIVVWMVVNVMMHTYMVLTHPNEPNSFVELALWIPAIAGLWLTKKWGAAFAVAVFCVTLGISASNLLLAYYSPPQLRFAPVNALRIILNAAAAAYLFRCIFAEKFK